MLGAPPRPNRRFQRTSKTIKGASRSNRGRPFLFVRSVPLLLRLAVVDVGSLPGIQESRQNRFSAVGAGFQPALALGLDSLGGRGVPGRRFPKFPLVSTIILAKRKGRLETCPYVWNDCQLGSRLPPDCREEWRRRRFLAGSASIGPNRSEETGMALHGAQVSGPASGFSTAKRVKIPRLQELALWSAVPWIPVGAGMTE